MYRVGVPWQSNKPTMPNKYRMVLRSQKILKRGWQDSKQSPLPTVTLSISTLRRDISERLMNMRRSIQNGTFHIFQWSDQIKKQLRQVALSTTRQSPRRYPWMTSSTRVQNYNAAYSLHTISCCSGLRFSRNIPSDRNNIGRQTISSIPMEGNPTESAARRIWIRPRGIWCKLVTVPGAVHFTIPRQETPAGISSSYRDPS